MNFLLLGVAIALIIVIIVFIILWQQALTVKKPGLNENGLLKFDVLSQCRQHSDCKDGLTCFKYTGFEEYGQCLVNLGEPCTTLLECQPAAKMCSLVCSTRASGDLNQPCGQDLECSSNLVCIKEGINPIGLCKKSLGSQCERNNQCFNNLCFEGECQPINDNGQICLSNVNCLSGNCSNGYCQTSGVITGQRYALCNYSGGGGVPQCTEPNYCVSTQYYPSSLSSRRRMRREELSFSVLSPNPTCQPSQQLPNIIQSCSSTNSCKPPLMCWNNQCILPRTVDHLLTNSCGVGTTGICSNGYQCVTGEDPQCLPENDNPSNEGIRNLVQWNVNNRRWDQINLHINVSNTSFLTSLDYSNGTVYIVDQIGSGSLERNIGYQELGNFVIVRNGSRIPLNLEVNCNIDLTSINVTNVFFEPGSYIVILMTLVYNSTSYYYTHLYFPGYRLFEGDELSISMEIADLQPYRYGTNIISPITPSSIRIDTRNNIPIMIVETIIQNVTGPIFFSLYYLITDISEFNLFRLPMTLHLIDQSLLVFQQASYPYIIDKYSNNIGNLIKATFTNDPFTSAITFYINNQRDRDYVFPSRDNNLRGLLYGNKIAVSYPVGAAVGQISLLYLTLVEGVFRLNYNDVLLPGYFNSNTSLGLSHKSNIPNFRVTDPTWTPTVSVITRTH
jgi:hypothetical protein